MTTMTVHPDVALLFLGTGIAPCEPRFPAWEALVTGVYQPTPATIPTPRRRGILRRPRGS